MNQTRSAVPLYHQVFGILRQRIVDGVYAVGDQLATEDVLADEFDVSRATVRQAVGELVSQGLVTRKQGRGTFVQGGADPGQHKRIVGDLSDLILGMRSTELRHIELEHDVPVSPRIRKLLNTEEPTGSVIRRVRAMNGEIFAYTVQHLAPAFAGYVTKEELEELGLLTLLERKGVRLGRATQSIRAQLADPAVANRLEVGMASAILYAERLLTSEDGSPVEFVEGWYRGDAYEWRSTFSIRRHGDRVTLAVSDT